MQKGCINELKLVFSDLLSFIQFACESHIIEITYEFLTGILLPLENKVLHFFFLSNL